MGPHIVIAFAMVIIFVSEFIIVMIRRRIERIAIVEAVRVLLIHELVVQVGRVRHVARRLTLFGEGEVVAEGRPAGAEHVAFAIPDRIRPCAMVDDGCAGRTRLFAAVGFADVEDAEGTLFVLAQDVGLLVTEVDRQGGRVVDEDGAFGVQLVEEGRDAVQFRLVTQPAAEVPFADVVPVRLEVAVEVQPGGGVDPGFVARVDGVVMLFRDVRDIVVGHSHGGRRRIVWVKDPPPLFTGVLPLALPARPCVIDATAYASLGLVGRRPKHSVEDPSLLQFGSSIRGRGCSRRRTGHRLMNFWRTSLSWGA